MVAWNDFIATIVLVAVVAAVFGAVLTLVIGLMAVVCWRTICMPPAPRARSGASLIRLASSAEEPLISPESAAANPEPPLQHLLRQLFKQLSAPKAGEGNLGSVAFHNLCRWIGSSAARQVVACEVEQIRLRKSWTSRATTARMVSAGEVPFGGGVFASLLVDKRSDATIHRGAFSSTRVGMLRRSGFADEYVAVTVRSATAVAVAEEEAALLAAMPPHINVVRRIFFDAPIAPASQPEWQHGMEVAELCAHSLSQPDLALHGAAFQKLLDHDPAVSLHIAQGILNGLQHIHAHALYHGNLKPASVLVSFFERRTEESPYGFDVKLADFGVAAALNGTNAFSRSSCSISGSSTSGAARGSAEGGAITGWRAPECYTLGRELLDVRSVARGDGDAERDRGDAGFYPLDLGAIPSAASSVVSSTTHSLNSCEQEEKPTDYASNSLSSVESASSSDSSSTTPSVENLFALAAAAAKTMSLEALQVG